MVEEVEVSRVSQTGGGEANGEQYVVEIHKEDEAGQRLAVQNLNSFETQPIKQWLKSQQIKTEQRLLKAC